jgi:hypothetical protein
LQIRFSMAVGSPIANSKSDPLLTPSGADAGRATSGCRAGAKRRLLLIR